MLKKLLFILVIFTANSLIFFKVSSTVRKDKIFQLNKSLEEQSYKENQNGTMDISGKILLLINRISEGDTSINNYIYEAKIQSMSNIKNMYNLNNKKQKIVYKTSVLSKIAGFILGTTKLEKQEIISYDILNEAYILEKNRRYREAKEKYTSFLTINKEIDNLLEKNITIHLIFINTMLGNYDKALSLSSRMYNNKNNLYFIDEIYKINELITLLKTRSLNTYEDSLKQGKELFFNVDYSNSVSTLIDFISQESDLKRIIEAYYYIGRSYEELGNVSMAVSYYLKLLSISTNENNIIETKRRLLMLRDFYDLSENDFSIVNKALYGYEDNEISRELHLYKELYTHNILKSFNTNKELNIFKGIGDIYIETSPKGAEIYIDDNMYGVSPILITSLPLGERKVILKFKDNKQVEIINVLENSIGKYLFNIKVKEKLNKVKGFGSLSINHKKYIDSIIINDNYYNYNRGDKITLETGNYKIRINFAQGDFWDGRVSILPNKKYILKLPNDY